MNLVIVESPTKAKTIGKFLGKEYKVVASYGHIFDLPKKQLGVDTENNFKPTFEVSVKGKKALKEIKAIAKTASKIYIATDPDREGEAIGYHIAQNLNEKGKSKVKEESQKSVRVVFHEITKEAVAEAFKNATILNEDLVNSQTARRVLDRLVGYKLSPLLWKKVRYGLSAGRVQSVAVKLIVERERERLAFKRLEYWEIEGLFTGQSKITAQLKKINDKDVNLTNQEVADQLVQDLKKQSYFISKVDTKNVKKSPYPPYTTSTLTQAAGNLLGFSAKRTMSAAQKLFEQGLITYHRTDSLNLSSSFIDTVRKYIEKTYGDTYLPEKGVYYKTKSKSAQEAHEAIRPTDVQLHGFSDKLQDLTTDELKLYELIWKRAISCQMVSAVYERVTVEISSKVTTNEQILYLFRSSAQILTFPGYLKAYHQYELNSEGKQKEVKGKNTELNKELNKVIINTDISLTEVTPSQHFTEPPARYSTASLIKELEQEGVGRPSTYASIISTIEARGYVLKEGKYFYPSDTAYVVNDLLVANFPEVVDIKFTAKIEEDLDKIAEGKSEWIPVIKAFYDPFNSDIESANVKLNKKDFTTLSETGEKCPECQSKLVFKLGRYGKFISCSNFPTCKYMKPVIEKTGQKCPDCNDGDTIVRRTKKGKIFYGCSNYPKCKWASWKKPELQSTNAEEN